MKINHDIVAVFFIGGNLSLLVLPTLITGNLFYCLLVLLIFLLIIERCSTRCSVWFYSVIFLLIGLLWSSKTAQQLQSEAYYFIDKFLNVVAIAETINISDGTHLSATVLNPPCSIIRFHIIQIYNKRLVKPLPIDVIWTMKDTPVYAGQHWRLALMSRAVHSRLNEGGFDSQRFAISKHVLLRGKVKSATLLDNKRSFRQVAVTWLVNKINLLSHADMMIALLFGERQGMTKSKKYLLFFSGIAHLMAISGMHVMLVASLLIRLSNFLQWFLPIHFISPTLPRLFGFFAALSYVWISGMNPPSLRAIVVFGAYLLLKLQNIEMGRIQLCLRLIALLILVDPLIVLSDSFWLSCFATLCLLFLYYWLPLPKSMKHKWWSPCIQLVHLQLGIMLLLLPIQIVLFNGVSVGGIVTNLLAVPLMSLFIMPLLIIGMVFFAIQLNTIASITYLIANWLLECILWAGNHLSIFWYWTSHQFCYIAFIGWLLVLTLRIALYRRFFITFFMLFLLMICPFFLTERYLWRVDMLDVGHGLAMIISQGNSAIIYDTGQNYEYSSEAETQIIPFLKKNNLRPKQIIVSHQHSDHYGGVLALKTVYPTIQFMSSSTQLVNNFYCQQGNKWRWKNIEFEVVWPPRLVNYADNDDSCVIRVTDGKFSLLLTGDLERQQEFQLIEKKYNIQSTILQIPHHGSNTSSSYAFLGRIKPELAINSTSRYNIWHLPDKRVISRYNQLKIPVLATREQGQITLYFYKDNWRCVTFRQQIKPRWYHDWFGALRKYG